MTDKTGVALTFLLVTGFTGFHHHHFGSVARNPPVSVYWVFIRFAAHHFMAFRTVLFGHFDVSRVGEENVVGLPRIDQPGDIPILFLQPLRQLDKIGLLLGVPLSRFVTFHTFGQRRDTGEGAVLPKGMAILALRSGPSLSVFEVAERHGLDLLAVDKSREDQPA
jgi:hypothetical protein